MVLNKITYFQILGMPLIVWLGIITLIALLFTALIPLLNKNGIRTISFRWHHRMAVITILLAIMHGLLAILAYF